EEIPSLREVYNLATDPTLSLLLIGDIKSSENMANTNQLLQKIFPTGLTSTDYETLSTLFDSDSGINEILLDLKARAKRDFYGLEDVQKFRLACFISELKEEKPETE